MAFEDYHAVWNIPGLTSSEKLVLLNLIDHRNDTDGQCNPSYNRIARETGLHRSFVIEAVGKFTKFGLLKVSGRTKDDGSQSSNQFGIFLDTENSRKLNGGGRFTGLPPQSSHKTPPVVSDDHGGRVTRAGVVVSDDPNDETERRSRTAKANGEPSPSQRRKEQPAPTSENRKSRRRKDEPLLATYESDCPICDGKCHPGERITKIADATEDEPALYAHWACANPDEFASVADSPRVAPPPHNPSGYGDPDCPVCGGRGEVVVSPAFLDIGEITENCECVARTAAGAL